MTRSRYHGDDIYFPVLQSFAADLPLLAAQVRSAFVGGDGDTFRALAHRLKGTARVLGFDALGELAADLERQEGSGSLLPALLHLLEREAVAIHAEYGSGSPAAEEAVL